MRGTAYLEGPVIEIFSLAFAKVNTSNLLFRTFLRRTWYQVPYQVVPALRDLLYQVPGTEYCKLAAIIFADKDSYR